MRTQVLFSGSKGNCTYISDGSTTILVDAGGTLKRIRDTLDKIGVSLNEIDAIFITHCHTDHVKALYTMCKKYSINIYTSLETARAICTPSKNYDYDTCCRLAKNIMTVKSKKTYDIGTISVTTVSTSHDCDGSLAFLFKSTQDNIGIGYLTDTGCVTEDIRALFYGVKNMVIESNHDIEMLKNGPYPEYLKERILSEHGHLSNISCAEFISDLARSGTRSFILAHLSEENNLPSVALDTATAVLSEYPDAVVRVASQYLETEAMLF